MSNNVQSEQRGEIVLPDYDITEEEKARARSCTGVNEWTKRQLVTEYKVMLTRTYCRSRQLLQALEQIARLEAEKAKAEFELRQMMWLGHGHAGMYGDDGEMQCGECAKFGCVDYKREPLDKVKETFRAAQMSRLKRPTPPQEGEQA